MLPWKLVALVSLAACYSPDTPECTLACTTETDCISGQTCTSDGFCAASSSTQCVQRQAPLDATAPPGDAPDAGATRVAVHVTVSGNGTVTANTGYTCTDDCTFEVDKNVPLTLTATASSTHQAFDRWTGACAAQPQVCHVTPDAAITVGAAFNGNGNGGN